MKEKIIVKYKRIIKIYAADGTIETQDFRYTTFMPKKKIIKFLLKNNFRFSVGIRENLLTNNLNYIEVYSDDMLTKNYWGRNNLLMEFLNKHSIKSNITYMEKNNEMVE